jgi:GTP-binding protein
MDAPFKIAVIGRPNVGKSSLFNRLTGSRRAIVDELPGVTRDRIEAKVHVRGRTAVLVDTGGYFEGSDNAIEESMRRQIGLAVKDAGYVLFVVDAAAGMHPMERTILQMVLSAGKPFSVIVNKADTDAMDSAASDFFSLGGDKLISVSAAHGRGIKELKDHLYALMPPAADEKEGPSRFRVCIVGKPNTGKSSLINAILQQERVIVTDIPGTTRDEIDISYSYKGQELVFIDTSGLRRKKLIQTPADQFGISRTEDTVRRASLNLLVIDGSEPLTLQDKRIGHMIFQAGKACVVVVNKSDLIDRQKKSALEETILEEMSFLRYAPVVFVSAAKRSNIGLLLDEVLRVKDKLNAPINTTELNKLLQKLQQRNLPPLREGKRLNIYYGVQVKKIPVEVLLFINSARCVTEGYMAYIQKGIMKRFSLNGIPVILRWRSKKGERKNKKPVDF